MAGPTLIDEGGDICPNCGENIPYLQYSDSGKKENLPCRKCNNEEFMKAFRAQFNKVVDEIK